MAITRTTNRAKRRNQPQHAALIDWSNPVTRGLLWLVGDASQSEAVTRTPVTKNGTVTYNKGSGYSFGTSSSASLIDAPTNNWTIFALAYAYSAAGFVSIASRTGGATASPSGPYPQNYVLDFSLGVTPRATHKNLVGGAYPTITSSFSAAAGSLCAAAGTFDGSVIRVYTNGALGGSVAATAPAQSFSPAVTQIGVCDGLDRVRPYQGRGILVAAIWNRALSDAEIRSLTANPYQVFQQSPAKSSLWLAPTGTVSRPNSDIVVSGWVGVPNASLYANVNEATASDSEYIDSPGLSATPTSCTFGLSLPLAAGSYDVGIRAQWVSQPGQLRVVLLDSGGTSVGASSYQALTSSATSYTLPVTTTGSATQARIEASL